MPAQAHPHVWVTSRSTIVYGPGGDPTAIRHAWRFDEMFSAFAIQGLDTDGDGVYSREELAELASVNVTSLKEFGFFTHVSSGGKEAKFRPPVDYWLEHDGKALTLHFTLPFAGAPRGGEAPLEIDIYDPTYFVDFQLAETDPATLAGAPAGCRADVSRPAGVPPAAGEKLTEQFFSSLTARSDFGQQFAQTITVRCGAAALAFANAQKHAAAALPPREAPVAPSFELSASDRAAEAAPAVETLPSEQVASRIDQALRIAAERPLEEAPAERPPETAPAPRAGNSALGAFGVVRPDGVFAATGGIFGWIAQRQAAFYQSMSQALGAVRQDGSALFLLAALSFAYGVFHAAGPGHGKAVISSYLVATGDTLKRGLAISFAAAIGQAVTAILIVGGLAMLLGTTGRAIGATAYWLEAFSYAAIVALGAALLYRKIRALVASRRGAAAHACGPDCGHSHVADPESLTGPLGWRRAAGAVLAVGLRPCTGALLVLVFALAQGMMWAGIAATFAMALGTTLTVAALAALAVGAKHVALRLASGGSGPAGAIALGGIEVLAGLSVLAFGLALLGGLIAAGAPVIR